MHAVKNAPADRGAVLGLLKPWDLTWATSATHTWTTFPHSREALGRLFYCTYERRGGEEKGGACAGRALAWSNMVAMGCHG